MSNQLFDWGNRSLEQAAIQRKLEEQAVYEQASRMAKFRQKAGQAPAGSGGDPLTGLYGLRIDGLVYQLNRSEANWPYNYASFPDSFTRLTPNKDDGNIYAIGDFEGTVYFVRIDRVTKEFEFIDNDIADFTVKGSCSLYYEGEGSFIYLDNFFKGTISSIVRITVEPTSPETSTTTLVSEVDSDLTGFALVALMPYDGAIWAIAYSFDQSNLIVGPFDIETGNFIYSNLMLPSPEEPNVVEITSVLGAVTHNGQIYVNAVWYDGDNYHLGLFKMDTEYGGVAAPYYIKFVKNTEDINGEAVITLASF